MIPGRRECAALAVGLIDALDVTVAELLEHCSGCELICEARALADVVHTPQLIAGLDLLVACVKSGSLHDLHCLQTLRVRYPGITVVALFDVQSDDTAARQTIAALLKDVLARSGFGAADPGGRQPLTRGDAEVPKQRPEDLGFTLTPRQQHVLHLIRRGLSNKHIARELGLSDGTVKLHCMAIFRALGVCNRTQAAIAADGLLLEEAGECTETPFRAACEK